MHDENATAFGLVYDRVACVDRFFSSPSKPIVGCFMRITDYDLLRLPPRWLFLRIETDAGHTGWGEHVVGAGDPKRWRLRYRQY